MQIKEEQQLFQTKVTELLYRLSDFEVRLPEAFDVKNYMQVLDIKDQTCIFFTNELVRYNILLRKVKNDLSDLLFSLRGESLISEEQEHTIQDFLNQQVPRSWREYSYETMKPYASWSEELITRFSTWREWSQGKKPFHFNLGFFYFPQGFLTAALQNHARKIKWPIEQVKFKFSVFNIIETVKSPPLDGVYISGIFTEGFVLKEHRRNEVLMEDVGPQSAIFNPSPIIHFVP